MRNCCALFGQGRHPLGMVETALDSGGTQAQDGLGVGVGCNDVPVRACDSHASSGVVHPALGNVRAHGEP